MMSPRIIGLQTVRNSVSCLRTSILRSRSPFELRQYYINIHWKREETKRVVQSAIVSSFCPSASGAQVTAPTPSTAVESTSTLPSSFLDTEAPASSVSIPAPDSRAVAKKAKELEREAKEKEFVDGQHANMINGAWHCSNKGIL
ncbi:uncharacterized protein HD556DRAFT_796902 [Suillus plorans]|uniref:Uncharacterized protein n=1 Tax=Suillus plorans TaxID=116603 RepID=A0A9P7J4D6_9AGAM|nr:uncharacterized protein HD556DRAFT_796902 [Suillus plorans]KAG1802080.1 hypothetical protein HD556DRAFT_796902 [Suillus plorans]